MSNAFTELTSPIGQNFYTAPSAAQGDKDNASTAIYRQLCQQMQRPENKGKFHVETTHDRSKLTTLTRSLAAVLVTIDHHRDLLLLGDADREFWEEHKEKRSMTNRKPDLDYRQLESRIAHLTNDIALCGVFLRTSRWQSFTLQLNKLVDTTTPHMLIYIYISVHVRMVGMCYDIR